MEPEKLPAILISINDMEDEPLEVLHEEKYLDVLRIWFSDIDKEIDDESVKLMSKNDAREILEFVTKYVDKATMIVVHCAAGISRSAAVAAALSLLIQGTEGAYYANRQYYPNIWVKTLLIRTALEESYITQISLKLGRE